MNTEAEINLFENIPLNLKVIDKNGEEVPGAQISGVVWNQSEVLGSIHPDPNDQSKAIFVPTKAGITGISATAIITVK